MEADTLGEDQDGETKQEQAEEDTDDNMKAGEDNVLMERAIVARVRMQHVRRHTKATERKYAKASQESSRTKVKARVKVSPRHDREVRTA